MKELQNIQPDKTELHAVKPIKKELQHIGSLRLQKGQKLWEMNLTTREIKEAEYEEVAAQFTGGATRKLITKEKHLYAPAINAINADRKFFKLLGLKYPKDSKPKIKV